jgi:hypothetical protein
VHDVLVGHVGVGEHDLVDVLAPDELWQLVLGKDPDAVRVALAGERRRVDAAVDVRDLRRREGDDLDVLPAAVDDVEVVEVPA